MHRYPELDFVRTIAVAMMVTYHATYDLSAFYGWDIDVFSGGWKLFARVTASLFLLLVGIGFAISWDRRKSTNRYPIKYLKRGLGLIGLGIIISLVTYMIDPATYVRFGILHLIGTGILLLPLCTAFKGWNVVLGMVVIACAWVVRDAAVPTSLLLPMGIRPLFFSSVDYFPLIPWLGVMLIGYGLGYFLYVRSPQWQKSFSLFPFHFSLLLPGRYALWIYLLHQPILLLVLTLILGLPHI